MPAFWPNHRAASSSVSKHGFQMYLPLFVIVSSYEVTYLAVQQLHSQGKFLADQFKRGRGTSCIDEAIILDREALELCPPSHPMRPVSLTSLATHLRDRYNQLGSRSGLEEAVILAREALDLCPKGHPDRSSSLNILAMCLFTRYKQLGDMEDFDQAIVLGRETLNLRPQGHPKRLTALTNFGLHLVARYEQLGVMEDLDEAIVLGREALYVCPKRDVNRSLSLYNLAIRLSSRYEQLGVTEDLDEAIALSREALDLCPKGHHKRPKMLDGLAIQLSFRYEQLEVMEDLDEAIVLSREFLDHCPKGHPGRSKSLENLAAHLSIRNQQLGVVEDLDEAIVLSREALDLRPQGHPNRSVSLGNLALHLYNRFIRSRQLNDKEEIFNLYAQLAYMPQVVCSDDLFTAREWTRVAENFQHPTILLAYETSLRLLIQYLAILPSLPQNLVILRKQTSSLAVDAFSACLRNHSLPKAVELLEQGRGVFWSQLTRLRFGRCHWQINANSYVISTLKYRELSPIFDNYLISLISFFLRSSRISNAPPVGDLSSSSMQASIAVTCLSSYLIATPFIFHCRSQLKRARSLLTQTLGSNRFANRRFLQTTRLPQSRIWWCPTGEFSTLPLHAAGPYRKGQQNLPNLYVSSYTPTLTALIRARRPDSSNPATPGSRFLAIGQAKAIGERELLSVGAELDDIAQRVSDVATFIRIEGDESCIPKVVEELGKNEWVHLACHGLPNRTQPFESAFALHDGRFTIQQIMKCDLKNPQFAYLSACHTTVGDEESPDEVIHLASTMQFVGFRSVIGTMWAVDDAETNKITSTFYKHMMDESGRLDHTRAAFALNKTMKSVCVPLDQQILYIHLGA
ncbi:CHAT domain-containing protein [Boletus edulis BED1]|uniref:CHAT domain-containing protein n=1 Tax=Boletus edulis BED1 TaxID=1328754 RepID=A0AAD4BIG7_BOLED|nr:CHAT domain-containing protein [Boletus edulis BED1]